MKKVLWASFVFGACAFGQAQLYVYDDFSVQNGGTGWGGDYFNSPLTYTSASPLQPGLGQYVEIGEFGEAFRQVSSAAKAAIDARTAGGNSFWVGFVTRWTGDVGSGDQNYGGVQLHEGGGPSGAKRFFMGVPWEFSNWGAARAIDDNNHDSGVPITADSVFLSFDINLSTHLADMYIDNVQVISDMQLDTASVSFTTLDYIKIEAGSSSAQKIAVDELRVGATSLDVQPVPEPATIAALSLGAMVLLRRRRK